MRGFGLCR
ncbi:hypothetical protein ID866_285 [Astraeus odoratus]|nr:hypothetical protein ID866_285 [Astraeus odoratus]